MKIFKKKRDYFHPRCYVYNSTDVNASDDRCVKGFKSLYSFGRPALAVARLATIAIIEYDPIADPMGVFTDPYEIAGGHSHFATDLMSEPMAQSIACIHSSDMQFTSEELQTALCTILRFIWHHKETVESMLTDDKKDLIRIFIKKAKDFDIMCDVWCKAIAIGVDILKLKTVDNMDKFAEVCKTFTEPQ